MTNINISQGWTNMIDKVLIEKKLRKIKEFLNEIEPVKVDSLEEFKNNVMAKRFIERNIELCIEQMIDVCKHLVGGLDLKEPGSYGECFEIISSSGIISAKNFKIYESMAKFRNFIIHPYDDVDDSIVYEIFKNHLVDFISFIDEIRNYLNK